MSCCVSCIMKNLVYLNNFRLSTILFVGLRIQHRFVRHKIMQMALCECPTCSEWQSWTFLGMVAVFTLSNFHGWWKKQPSSRSSIWNWISHCIHIPYLRIQVFWEIDSAIFELSRSGKQIEIYDYPTGHPNDYVSLWWNELLLTSEGQWNLFHSRSWYIWCLLHT